VVASRVAAALRTAIAYSVCVGSTVRDLQPCSDLPWRPLVHSLLLLLLLAGVLGCCIVS
jgi:hypothetical protein